MTEFFQQILHMDPVWAYSFLFISAIVENIFPPIPGDTVTILGAYLVGRGVLGFWGVFISTTLGSVVGFMAIFGLAWWLEWKVLEKVNAKWVKRDQIEKVERWVNRFGFWIIFLNRFLSGARSVISFVAGLSKMNWLVVLLLATASAALWNGILIYFGSQVGENWPVIIEFLKTYNRIMIISGISIFVAYVLYKFISSKRTSS